MGVLKAVLLVLFLFFASLANAHDCMVEPGCSKPPSDEAIRMDSTSEGLSFPFDPDSVDHIPFGLIIDDEARLSELLTSVFEISPAHAHLLLRYFVATDSTPPKRMESRFGLGSPHVAPETLASMRALLNDDNFSELVAVANEPNQAMTRPIAGTSAMLIELAPEVSDGSSSTKMVVASWDDSRDFLQRHTAPNQRSVIEIEATSIKGLFRVMNISLYDDEQSGP